MGNAQNVRLRVNLRSCLEYQVKKNSNAICVTIYLH